MPHFVEDKSFCSIDGNIGVISKLGEDKNDYSCSFEIKSIKDNKVEILLANNIVNIDNQINPSLSNWISTSTFLIPISSFFFTPNPALNTTKYRIFAG